MIGLEIAYVYDAVYPWVKGGAERRVHEMSVRLARRGHRVHIYGIKWWDGTPEMEQDGVLLHGICRAQPLYSGRRRSVGEAMAFAGSVLRRLPGDLDAVDCQEFPYLPCFSARARVGRQNLLITWHEVWGRYWQEYLGGWGMAGQLVERVAAHLTQRNIAVSERTLRDLEDLGAARPALLPNGIDQGQIDAVVPADEGADIIYVGRLAAHKNLHILVEAIDLLKADLPQITALVVGDGPERLHLSEMIEKRGLCSQIRMTGFVEDFSEALSLVKSSRLFVLPSTREGFGMAALEALACGVPVITFDHPRNAAADLVGDGRGLLCRPDAQSLAEAIRKGLGGHGIHRERCRDYAMQFDWERICSRAEELYDYL